MMLFCQLDQLLPCSSSLEYNKLSYSKDLMMCTQKHTHNSLVIVKCLKSTCMGVCIPRLRGYISMFCVNQAIEHFMAVAEPDYKQVCRCLLNLVSLLVHSPQTTSGRARNVSHDDVNRAKRSLMHLNRVQARNADVSMRQIVQVRAKLSRSCTDIAM